MITFHPTTLARDTNREADALFSAASTMAGPLLFCYPNADAGSRALIERMKGLSRVFVNLDPIVYWSLLKHADLLLGNSSSGIIEAASFQLPVVNVGMRQRGRERGPNVLDAEPTAESILDCVARARSGAFRQSLQGMKNLYGDGEASARIVSVLASVPLGEQLLIKRAA